MIKYFRQQIAEIQESRVLKIYGIFLVLVHLITAYFWRFVPAQMLNDDISSCWPFFLQCNSVKSMLTPLFVSAYSWSYVILAVITLFCFLFGRITAAYILFLITNLMKYLVLIQSFHLMGNYHFMPFVISLVYLFIPNKKLFIPFFVVSFYFAAGTLKLNPEWLSGAALLSNSIFPPKLLEFGLAGVVILELCLVWLLFVPNIWIRAGTFVLFVAFHAVSYLWVGYFYPSVMSCLLMIFVLKWILKEPLKQYGTKVVGISALAFFWFCQAATWAFPGDIAVTGEFRTFALNMYDAKTSCVSLFVAEYGDRDVELQVRKASVALRVQCDPISYWTRALLLCDELKEDPTFKDMSFMWSGKRTTDPRFTSHIRIRNFCTQRPHYSSFLPNEWMHHE